MSIISAYSERELSDAVADLKAQSGGCEPRMVIFFASPRYDPLELSQRMRAAFPGACVAGCTTAGEIAGCKMMRESVSAMFLDEEIVGQTAFGVVENLTTHVCVSEAFSRIEQQLDTQIGDLDIQKYVGLVLVDGLSGAEEALMERIGDRTDLFFVGGSAGDDLKFDKTHVMVDGKSYTDAAVLLVLEMRNGFDIVKTQSFRGTGRTLTATDVDEPTRLVLKFDNKPALQAYAQALGVPLEKAPTLFMQHPLGLMVDGDPFVRSPQRVTDRGIVFYCQIRQGMELEVLDATDIVAQTRQAIESKAGSPIRGIIDFQCILRTLQLRAEDRCKEYGAIFSGIPTAGFSTYGEAYLGHINQTSTMLVLR